MHTKKDNIKLLTKPIPSVRLNDFQVKKKKKKTTAKYIRVKLSNLDSKNSKFINNLYKE